MNKILVPQLKKGSVLLTVMVVLTILLLLYVSFLKTRKSIITQSDNTINERRAYFLAHAGFNHAFHKIRYSPVFLLDSFRYLKHAFAKSGAGIGGRVYFDPKEKDPANTSLDTEYYFNNKKMTIREYLIQFFKGVEPAKEGKLTALSAEFADPNSVPIDLGHPDITGEYEVKNMYFRFTMPELGKNEDGTSRILDTANQFWVGVEVESRVWDKGSPRKDESGKDIPNAQKFLTKEVVFNHNTFVEIYGQKLEP